MNHAAIVRLRLWNQHLSGGPSFSPRQLVQWMGAMQAQDYPMVKWAMGIRLPGTHEDTIQAALDRGEILRTHVLRPTWHIIPREDIRWMLRLTAPNIEKSMKTRHQELGLTPAMIRKSKKTILEALDGRNFITREELVEALKKNRIPTTENRTAHILAIAELDEMICSGMAVRNKQTYTLLDRIIPDNGVLNQGEALTCLAGRYFQSHGPATLADFTWWSGLPAGLARQSLESIQAGLESFILDNREYWMKDPGPQRIPSTKSAYLLPAYDEFIISYRERGAFLQEAHRKKSISDNGIFWPAILSGGQVIGKWRRTINKHIVHIRPEFFSDVTPGQMASLKKAAKAHSQFLRMPAMLET